MYTDQNGMLIVIDNNLLAEYVTQILSIDVTENLGYDLLNIFIQWLCIHCVGEGK